LLISVIVPVYNVAQYLPRCIESILAQTHSNIELILIDDGSSDESGAICDEYAAKDSRIITIHQENAGASASRNAGLDAANGEWIGFVDADDFIDATMYEKLLAAAIANGVQMAACGYVNRHPNGTEEEILLTTEPARIDKETALEYIVCGGGFTPTVWNKLCSKTVIGGSRFDKDLHIGEDKLFLIEITATCENGAVYVPEGLYQYCVRDDSVLMQPFTPRRLSALDAYEKITARVAAVSKRLETMAQAQLVIMAASIIILATSPAV